MMVKMVYKRVWGTAVGHWKTKWKLLNGHGILYKMLDEESNKLSQSTTLLLKPLTGQRILYKIFDE